MSRWLETKMKTVQSHNSTEWRLNKHPGFSETVLFRHTPHSNPSQSCREVLQAPSKNAGKFFYKTRKNQGPCMETFCRITMQLSLFERKKMMLRFPHSYLNFERHLRGSEKNCLHFSIHFQLQCLRNVFPEQVMFLNVLNFLTTRTKMH